MTDKIREAFEKWSNTLSTKNIQWRLTPAPRHDIFRAGVRWAFEAAAKRLEELRKASTTRNMDQYAEGVCFGYERAADEIRNMTEDGK
jgi:hypothetical protein